MLVGSNTYRCPTNLDPRHTSFTYDAADNLTSVTDGLLRTTTMAYNSLNDMTRLTAPDNARTDFTYDSRGNPTTLTRPLGARTTFAYDAARPGDMTSLTDALSKVWQFTYDAAGNQTSSADPLGNRVSFGYDGLGRPTSVVSARGNAAGSTPSAHTTVLAYNVRGDLVSATDPLGAVRSWTYNPVGNLASAEDAHTHASTAYSYDAADQLIGVARPDGTSLAYGYDPAGNLIRQTDGAARSTLYTYDSQDRLSTMTDPGGRLTRYEYDPAGNRTALIEGGLRSDFRYDDADQLIGIDHVSTATPDVSFGYDAAGRRVTMTDGTGTNTYAYDANARLTSSRNGAGATVSYAYDARDAQTSLSYPTGSSVSRTYDAAGRLVRLVDTGGQTSDFAYDADSNLVSTARPNATTTSYSFDNVGRPSGIDHRRTAGPSLAAFAYTRDREGYVASVVPGGAGGSAESYTYNALDQLASLNSTTFAHDPADNLTAMGPLSMAYDTVNQLSSATRAGASTNFSYDNRGNRILANPPVMADSAFTYDQANRMTTATPSSSFVAMATGDAHSLARRSDGSVWAWGGSGSGELGNGGSTGDARSPQPVPGLGAVTTVVSGDYHNVALDSSGSVWAWGRNLWGQVGTGATLNNLNVPTRINLPPTRAIAAGESHSLSVDVAGTVRGWGYNLFSQVGSGGLVEATPRPVPGAPPSSAVAAGGNFSAALATDGRVWVWGSNSDGQQGSDVFFGSSTPTPLALLSGVSAIAAGQDHGLALRSNGEVWAWGANYSGQLGIGSTDDSTVARRVGGLPAIASVAAGGEHSLARGTDGSLWAWGANAGGQLGTGDTTNRLSPVRVAPPGSVTSVSGGYRFSLASTPDGGALAFGENNFGQLGTGIIAASRTPMAVATLVAAYAYDGDGLRASKTVAATTKAFTWDVSGPMPMLLSDGTATYVYGPGARPLSRTDANGTQWSHEDQLGSIRMTTNSAGAIASAGSYEAYGNPSAPTTGTVVSTNPLGYTGEYTDPETGFQYLRNRYYDPVTGQFLTRDPITAITQEPYGYVGGNPLNYVDPLGLYPGQGLVKKAGKVVGDVARSGTAQWIKDQANLASTVTAGIAAVAGVGAVAIPVFAPALVPIALGAERVSAGTGAIATLIECADGGPGFDCVAGIAATAIPLVSFPLVKQLERQYGETLSRKANAALSSFGFGAAGANAARDRRLRC